jgi:hypothetical protein
MLAKRPAWLAAYNAGAEAGNLVDANSPGLSG